MKTKLTMERVDTRLFIGGPADGRRKSVMHGNRVEMVLSAPMNEPLNTAVYHARDIRGDQVVFRVWVYDGMSPDEVLRALFHHYRRPDFATIEPA